MLLCAINHYASDNDHIGWVINMILKLKSYFVEIFASFDCEKEMFTNVRRYNRYGDK